MQIIETQNVTIILDGNVTDEVWHVGDKLLSHRHWIHLSAEAAEHHYAHCCAELENIERGLFGAAS